MKRLLIFSLLVVFFLGTALLQAQTIVRPEISVPKVDTSVIRIDGVMDEAEWATAAQANLVTASGFEIWAVNYYRDGLAEPEFDEYYGRILWTNDTLYVFVHIDEVVNDSTTLYWGGSVQSPVDTFGHWTGDQLFIGISNRFGMTNWENYEGNALTAPDGPYHLMIMKDKVTFNDNFPIYDPAVDSGRVIPTDFIRSGVTFDSATGVWNVELAIYHPNVRAQSSLGFNIGGSMGSHWAYDMFGDAYGYYAWQPHDQSGDPWADPTGGGWVGDFIQRDSRYWAVLNFTPGADDLITRPVLNVPMLGASVIEIDGVMDEPAWEGAAQANLVTASGFEIWAVNYYRDGLAEPEFDEYYGRILWTNDTLYVFVHIDEVVNDSTTLYWGGSVQSPVDTFGHWTGDQLFVGVSNRFGMTSWENYEGNALTAPDGPYHLMIMKDQVTFNDNFPIYDPAVDSGRVIPTDFIRSAAVFDSASGVWKVEMAIYHPNVRAQASVAFNIGGSMGSHWAYDMFGDAYGYYAWQPHDQSGDPWADPTGGGWVGDFIQRDSRYWAVLKFGTNLATSVGRKLTSTVPNRFNLEQNYPNPFNPTTKIEFAVPVAGRVTLEVYNLLGQKVATLFDGMKPVGVYETNWDASGFGSGIYFLRLVSEQGPVLSRKMVLVR